MDRLIDKRPSRYEREMNRQFILTVRRFGEHFEYGYRTKAVVLFMAWFYNRLFGHYVEILEQRPDISEHGNFTSITGRLEFSDHDLVTKPGDFLKKLESEFWDWAGDQNVPMQIEMFYTPEHFKTIISWGPAEPVECPGT